MSVLQKQWFQMPLLSATSLRESELRDLGWCRNKSWIKKVRDVNRPRSTPLIEHNLLDYHISQGWKIDVDRDNKSIVDIDQLSTALFNYGTNRSLSVDHKLLDRAVNLAYAAFGNPREALIQPMPMDSEILQSAIKLDKSSGIPELTSKLEAWDKDFVRAQNIMTGEQRMVPCICYNRVQHKSTGPKTRMVWCYPLSTTILEARFARPLIMHYLSHKGFAPMAFGMVKHQVSALITPIENCRFRCSLDYSQFDASIPRELIYKAFNILSTYLDLSDPVDQKSWDDVVKYFIYTTIIMPNGRIYQKNRGIPSGSYFTQLVGSIVNYICLQYAYLKTYDKALEDKLVKVLGDDSCFGSNQPIKVKSLVMAIAELGITVSVDKSATSHFGEPLPFLGCNWIGGYPSRDPFELVIRMTFPERHRKLNGINRHLSIYMAYLATCVEAWPLFLTWRHQIVQVFVEELISPNIHFDLDDLSPGWLDKSQIDLSVPENLLYLGMLY